MISLDSIKSVIKDVSIEIDNMFLEDEVSGKMSALLDKLSNQSLTVAFVGEINSGKSSLINSLIGEQILDSGNIRKSHIIYEIHFSSEGNYFKYVDNEGNIQTENEFNCLNRLYEKGIEYIQLFLSSEIFPKNTIILDTPGFTSENQQFILEKVHQQADVIFFTMDVNQSLTANSLRFIEKLHNKVLLVLTKKDTKLSEELRDLILELKNTYRNLISGITTFTIREESETKEIRNIIMNFNDKRDIIISKKIKAEFENICNEVESKVMYLLSIDNLDLTELEIEQKERQIEIDKIQTSVERELDEFSIDLFEIESEVVRHFETKLFSQTEEIIDATLKSGHNLEFFFKSKISIISEEVVSIYISKICDRIDKLKNSLTIVAKIEGYNLNSDYFDFTQKINIRDGLPLLNFITSFLVGIADKLERAEINELDSKKKSALSAMKALTRAIELGTALVSRKQIKNDLENAFKVIKADFVKIIHDDLLRIKQEIVYTVNTELDKIENNILKSIEQIRIRRKQEIDKNYNNAIKLKEIKNNIEIWRAKINEI